MTVPPDPWHAIEDDLSHRIGTQGAAEFVARWRPRIEADGERLRTALAGVVADHYDDGHDSDQCANDLWLDARRALQGAPDAR